MKQSQVFLSSQAQDTTNNQDFFITNQYLDHITEQKQTNLELINSFSGLNKSCQKILNTLQQQNINFNAQKNKERHNHLQLKNILQKISLTTQKYQTSYDKQESAIQEIMHQLTKHTEISSNLQKRISNQQTYLNNLVINQKKSFEDILKQLRSHDIRQTTVLEHQNNTTQEVLEKIDSQKLQLTHQFDKQDDFNTTVNEDLEGNKRLMTTLLEKQNLLELRQQKLMINMEERGERQEETLSDVKDLLRKLDAAKGSIHKLLSSLPTNYPIKQLVVSGKTIPVRSFVMSNEKNGIAIFSNGTESIYIAIDKIEAIYWT